MQKNTIMTQPISSSFLSCEKDTELILKKLFIESRPYSDVLKRLLVVQAPDCLDRNYDVSEYSLSKLVQEKFIVLDPVMKVSEHSQIKSFIGLHFDGFTMNTTNPQFRDSLICIDVACHHDHWFLGNYRQRPFKILGYIDGILNNTNLTGIGRLNFVGCSTKVVNEDWTVFMLTYMAVHGSDDKIPYNANEE